MHCYLCRANVTAHIIRPLQAAEGPRGWTRLCIPCAMRHDMDGLLFARHEDGALAQLWQEHRRGRESGGPPEAGGRVEPGWRNGDGDGDGSAWLDDE